MSIDPCHPKSINRQPWANGRNGKWIEKERARKKAINSSFLPPLIVPVAPAQRYYYMPHLILEWAPLTYLPWIKGAFMSQVDLLLRVAFTKTLCGPNHSHRLKCSTNVMNIGVIHGFSRCSIISYFMPRCTSTLERKRGRRECFITFALWVADTATIWCFDIRFH